MTLSRLFHFTVVLMLLSACSQSPVKDMAIAPAPGEETANPETRALNLPKQDLSRQVLYQFLLAEIAGQRGNVSFATQSYIDLAKNTRDPRVAQRATEIALFARNAPLALEAARLWLTIDPEAVQAKQTVAALLVNNGTLDEARPYLQKLVEAEGNERSAGFMHLNGLLAKQQDKKAVLGLIRELAKPYNTLPEARFAVAQAAWNAGDSELALSEIRAAAQLKPDWEIAALFQGQILQRKENNEAAEFYRSYLKQYSRAGDVRMAYARLLVGEKKYDEARAQFQQLLTDFPGNADVSMAVGLLSIQLKDMDAAETYIKQSLTQGYKDQDAGNIYLGELNEERKRYDQAIKWYNAVSRGEKYLPAQMRIAGLLAKQGKLEDARKYLQQLPTQNNQQRVQIIQAEALLLREAKAYQAAYDLLTRSLEKLPNHPDLLYEYAMAAEKVNRFDVMEQSLRKLIQLKPDHAHAYNALGYTLADRNERLSEALPLVEKALKLAPDDPFIMDSLGWVYYRMGNLPKALETLQRAYAKRPDPDIAAHLGEILWAQGRREEAAKLWRSSLKENPANEALLVMIKKFKL